MGGLVDVWGESIKIDTYTYTVHMPACSWRPSLNEEERSLLLALVVGDDCNTVFCLSEAASTVAATTPTSFYSG